MMAASEPCFRVGVVAKKFGVSTYRVRKLLECGLMNGELSETQQWQVPASEIARFEKSGLPPVPVLIGPGQAGGELARRAGNSPTPGLLAPPSDEVVSAAEGVVITENLVKRRKLERELEETEDWFREREAEEEEQLAAQQQAELERAEAERQRKVREKAEREREEWLESWVRYAFRSLPLDAPPELRLEVHQAISARLLQLQPIPSRDVTGKLVDALVERTLIPWRRRKEIEGVLVQARDWGLPSQARGIEGLSTWQVKAVRAAADAIDKLRNDASIEEVKAVANQAVAAVSQEFEHSEQCQRLVKHLWLELRDATDDELLAAQREVEKALACLPSSASQRDRETGRDNGIRPLREQIAARLAERARSRAEQARRFQADLKLTNLHSLIFDHIGHLGKPDELEFTGFEDQWGTAGKLEEKIRPALFQELLGDLNLTDAQIGKRIEKLVAEHLDEVLMAPAR
jgi:hypothetical protein